MWAVSVMNLALELWSRLVQVVRSEVLELSSLMLPDLFLIQLARTGNFPSIIHLVVIELLDVTKGRH